jgi:hypothetical protein
MWSFWILYRVTNQSRNNYVSEALIALCGIQNLVTLFSNHEISKTKQIPLEKMSKAIAIYPGRSVPLLIGTYYASQPGLPYFMPTKKGCALAPF